MHDFERPPHEPVGGGVLKDRNRDRLTGSTPEANHVEPGDHNQRTEIVSLPEDEFALDLFASESDLGEVPAPSRGAASVRPKAAAVTRSTRDRPIEPMQAPELEPIRDNRFDPIQHYQIDPARSIAIEPVREYVGRGSRRAPRTGLLRRFSIVVVLALGVFGGGLAGLYLRRHPLDLAIVRIAVDDAARPATIAAPASETASPRANGDVGTAGGNGQPVTTSAAPPVAPGGPPASLAPPPEPEVTPADNTTPASTRTETTVPGPPRGVTENPSPAPVVVPPAPTPPPRTDPLTAAGTSSTRGSSDVVEAPTPSQSTPIAAGAAPEAPALPPAAAATAPVAPDAGTSSTSDRGRVADATRGIAAAADEQRIADVLKRFTDAYTQLNAPAAKAVWPSVDDRALARAFDALESQSIAFDDCTVNLAGAEARAACVGNITYVPKIGRRSARTVNRHWSFVMKRNGDGWMIADAQMR